MLQETSGAVDALIPTHKRTRAVTCVFRRRHKRGPVSILQGLVDDEVASRAPHIVLIDQLFAFIGSNPEKAVRGACWQNAPHSFSSMSVSVCGSVVYVRRCRVV